MAFNYNRDLFNDYEEITIKNKKLNKDNMLLKLKLDVAESEAKRYKARAEKAEENIDKITNEKDAIINSLKAKIIELQKKLDNTEYERDHFKSKTLNDGTNSGISTALTPIDKNKKIPNSRVKSDRNIGGQKGHEKSKLDKFNDEEINEEKEITLKECPHCHSKNLEHLDEDITKDELDYKIKIIKRRNKFKSYKCHECGKIVRAKIPTRLKEDNQYGSNVQATALTLSNVGNVPMNKIRRIVDGLTLGEITMSEGYIAKLQKRASENLATFIKDLKFYITNLKLLYWDDTVIMINTKRSCMRFYGDEKVSLYCAHSHKDKKGLDEDGIFNKLTSRTIVEHDHLSINYNDEYSFVNAECCQHLIRDLEKVSINIPNRTWSKKLKELFQEYIHKRNQLITEGKDRFSDEEFDSFISGINNCLLLGVDEYCADKEKYYADKEQALLIRMMEYRDNYIYWTLDFDLPVTNNLSERSLRGIKSKMKVAGQFQNINTAQYYANIKSYIETCHRNGVNEHEALCKLIDEKPYKLEEILEIGKSYNEKKAT